MHRPERTAPVARGRGGRGRGRGRGRGGPPPKAPPKRRLPQQHQQQTEEQTEQTPTAVPAIPQRRRSSSSTSITRNKPATSPRAEMPALQRAASIVSPRSPPARQSPRPPSSPKPPVPSSRLPAVPSAKKPPIRGRGRGRGLLLRGKGDKRRSLGGSSPQARDRSRAAAPMPSSALSPRGPQPKPPLSKSMGSVNSGISKSPNSIVSSSSGGNVPRVTKITKAAGSEESQFVQSSVEVADDAKRKNIAMEMLSTERSYVTSLQEMIDVYMKPLMEFAAAQPHLRVDRGQVKGIFSNVESIVAINSDLLKQLEERMKNWGADTLLGDVFYSVAPFLKMYTVYSNQYQQGLETFSRFCTEIPQFAEEVDKLRTKATGNMGVDHLLIMPIQRVPRYNLLLTDLIKKTPATHPDWKRLNQALLRTKEVANHINRGVRQAENMRRLAQSSTKGAGFKNLMEAHRQLLMDGVLSVDASSLKEQAFMKVPKRRKAVSGLKKRVEKPVEKIHFFLFNDRLVYAHKSDVAKQRDMSKASTNWPLNLVWVQDSGADGSFRLHGPNRYFIVLSNEQEKKPWVTALKQAINAALEPHKLNNDSAEREGSFEFYPGAEYAGCWRLGKMHGQGSWRFGANAYEGSWADGEKDGPGQFSYFTGASYEGSWSSNLPNGEGVLSTPAGVCFRGTLENNHKVGKGSFQWPCANTSYEGPLLSDLPHGAHGAFRSDPFTYEGSFQNGVFHGQGTLHHSSGMTYAGNWKRGVREGNGICKYADGSVYEGDWAGGLPHGQGKYVSVPDGYTYDGRWQHGHPDGKGTKISAFQGTYTGKWKDGKRNGKGELLLPGGDMLTGSFRDDLCHGGAVLKTSNGISLEGNWVQGCPEGKLALTIPSVVTDHTQPSRWEDLSLRLTAAKSSSSSSSSSSNFNELSSSSFIAHIPNEGTVPFDFVPDFPIFHVLPMN